jgi:hypothetical protein
MHVAGDEEIEAIAAAIRGKALFHYGVGNESERLEQRYAAAEAAEPRLLLSAPS